MGCKKENARINQSKQITNELSNDGNILNFTTIESYVNFVSDENNDLENDLAKIRTTKFQNYLQSKENSSSFQAKSDGLAENTNEMDDLLGQLLNRDGAIIINNKLFKIDIIDQKVYVIDFLKDDDYNIAIKKIKDKDKSVKIYSTDDDVLDLVENEGFEQKSCGGIGSGTYPVYSNNNNALVIGNMNGTEIKLNAGVKYFKAGIYFKLSCLYELINLRSNGIYTIEIKTGGTLNKRWYQKRPCKSGDQNNGHTGLYMWNETGYQNQKTYYSGARGLNGYYFYVSCRGLNPATNTWSAWSPWGGRNINSPF